MKRLTVSLPDDLAARLKEAAGGSGKVSAYVADALAERLQGESLTQILADWERDTPVPQNVRHRVAAEMDQIGFRPKSRPSQAG